MTFEASITAGTILATLGIMFSVAGSIFGLGWKINGWIQAIQFQRQLDFEKLTADIKENVDSASDKIRTEFHEHEEHDQQRHEENIAKFSIIDVRLARIGNGSLS